MKNKIQAQRVVECSLTQMEESKTRVWSQLSPDDLCYLCMLSRSIVSDSLWTHGFQSARLLCPWDFSGKNTRVGSHSLLQMIFPTQRSNSRLLYCRQILYPLSYWGSPTTFRKGLPKWLSGKESTFQHRKCAVNPGLGRSPWKGDGYPLQYSCLENPMDRGA